MNSVVYFEIQSSNPQREVKFYETIFGWKFYKEDSLPIEYYRIETEGIKGGLLMRPVQIPGSGCGTNAFCCTIEVENFDKMAETILNNGGRVALPKFAIPGLCWQGYFLDEDNNVFGIFQEDKDAK